MPKRISSSPSNKKEHNGFNDSQSKDTNRGNVKCDLKDYLGAISDYTKSIEIEPKNSFTYLVRSNAKDNLKDYQGAISDINEFISLEPQNLFNNLIGYNNRGIDYLKLSKYDDAIADFKKTISLKSDFDNGYINIGYVYLQQGKIEIAADFLEQGLKYNDKSLDGNVNLSIIYYLKGNLQESKKNIDVAKSIEPRLSKGIDGIYELEKEGYFWTDKDKETLKKMFEELK